MFTLMPTRYMYHTCSGISKLPPKNHQGEDSSKHWEGQSHPATPPSTSPALDTLAPHPIPAYPGVCEAVLQVQRIMIMFAANNLRTQRQFNIAS